MDRKFMVLIFISMSLSYIDGVGLSYNYFDEIAQTYCQSRLGTGWVFSLRRDCNGMAPTCYDICNTAKSDILKTIGFQRQNVTCFDALHLIKKHAQLAINPDEAQPDAGKASLGTYGYGVGGCSWTPNHCGPNYCCCKAF